jgi:hypothetical protein
MRSFNPKASFTIMALTASLLAVPFAGAYAAQQDDHTGAVDVATPTAFQGPRIDSILNQLHGIDQGVANARQAKMITPAVAHRLEMRDANISKAAERVAAADHGRLPAGQYHELMHRVDNLDRQLLKDTGSAMLFGNGADGGNYPNG